MSQLLSRIENHHQVHGRTRVTAEPCTTHPTCPHANTRFTAKPRHSTHPETALLSCLSADPQTRNFSSENPSPSPPGFSRDPTTCRIQLKRCEQVLQVICRLRHSIRIVRHDDHIGEDQYGFPGSHECCAHRRFSRIPLQQRLAFSRTIPTT